jgi:succinoglycan biosynthesis protein ExoL
MLNSRVSGEKNFLILSPSTSQPRIIKRAKQIKKIAPVKIIAFSREYYNENTFDPSMLVHIVAKISDQKYLIRTLNLLRFYLRLITECRRSSRVYVFSLDLLILAYLSFHRLEYYEIGDLRTCEKPNSIVSKLERFLIKRTQSVLVTSWSYYEDYFRKYGLPKEKFHLVENKVNLRNETYQNIISKNYHPRIRIGLIGFLRYQDPIVSLINFVKKFPEKYEIVCFGDGPFKNLIQDEISDSLSYFGAFSAESDLDKIYNNIDVNYIVYDNSNNNVRMAIPNKFYESLYFNKPMIAAVGTHLATLIHRYDVGFSISIESSEFDKELKFALERKKLIRWTKNCQRVEPNIFLDDSDILLQSILR